MLPTPPNSNPADSNLDTNRRSHKIQDHSKLGDKNALVPKKSQTKPVPTLKFLKLSMQTCVAQIKSSAWDSWLSCWSATMSSRTCDCRKLCSTSKFMSASPKKPRDPVKRASQPSRSESVNQTEPLIVARMLVSHRT